MRIKQLELAWHSRDRTQHDDQTVFGQKDWQYRNSQKIVVHPAWNGTNTVTHLLWEPRTSSFLSQPKQSWTAFEPAPARQSWRGLHSAFAYSQPLFADEVLQEINKYIKDIQNGTEDFSRFNLSEHAGLSKGGSPLIGASIIACYATASIAASCNAEGREGSPANWEIDRSVFARLVMGRV